MYMYINLIAKLPLTPSDKYSTAIPKVRIYANESVNLTEFFTASLLNKHTY